MTVQTEVRPGGTQVQRRPIRGLRGFVVGMAAVVAAGTGIGIAVTITGNDRPAVVAPDSPETTSLKNMHAENYANPGSDEQLDALKRHHEDAQATSEGSFGEALKRFKDEAWSK